MQIPPLSSVDCALLHSEFAPMNAGRLLDAITALIVEIYEADEVKLIPSANPRDVHAFAAGNRILISQNDRPLAKEGFQSCLSAPITQMLFAKAQEEVTLHTANTFVTVGKGLVHHDPDMPLTQEILDAIPVEERSFVTSEEAEKAIALCAELSRLILEHHPATAVHWCPSDFLISQSVFENLTAGKDYTMIGIRPSLTSSEGQMGQGLPLGMIATGSEWLIGKQIVFDEAPVPLDWLMRVIPGFVSLCRMRGAVFGHKESFSVEGEDWKIGVFHQNAEAAGAVDRILLKLIHAPQFGIEGEHSAETTIKYRDEDHMREVASAQLAQPRDDEKPH